MVQFRPFVTPAQQGKGPNEDEQTHQFHGDAISKLMELAHFLEILVSNVPGMGSNVENVPEAQTETAESFLHPSPGTVEWEQLRLCQWGAGSFERRSAVAPHATPHAAASVHASSINFDMASPWSSSGRS